MDKHEEKFSIIYDEYIEKIYRFVYLKINLQEVAEDISSKVFLNYWESYKKAPEKIYNERAFLYRIARNMVIDYYRDKDRTRVVSIDNLPQIVDENAGVHERAVLNSDMEAVKSAIQNLKKDYQDVLIWHYLEDMPITEISEILEKSPGTIRVMIHRGLNAVKNELNQAA